jgi:hypothetical protein
MAALSQLSYGPLMVSKSSREVEVLGPIDATALVVSTRSDPERNRWPVGNSGDWDEETPI